MTISVVVETVGSFHCVAVCHWDGPVDDGSSRRVLAEGDLEYAGVESEH